MSLPSTTNAARASNGLRRGKARSNGHGCRSFAANAVRLQLHALAYNLGNFLRTLATPEPIKDWWEPSCHLALPKSLRSYNFTLAKAVIRWMSGNISF